VSPWRLVPACSFRAMPWRNGGGTTWEIARGRIDGRSKGDGDGYWHWRVSLAEIAADGPFSTFPDVDRLLTVVAGAGIDLTIDGAEPRRLDRGDSIQFRGEAAIGCTLVAGPTRDLNLMVDRRVARLVPGNEERRMMAAEDDTIVLYALEEVALRIEAERRVVAAGDAIIGAGGAEAVIERGRAVWARVERLRFL
jgi:environmental stress-induced protein Ves